MQLFCEGILPQFGEPAGASHYEDRIVEELIDGVMMPDEHGVMPPLNDEIELIREDNTPAPVTASSRWSGNSGPGPYVKLCWFHICAKHCREEKESYSPLS